MGLWNKTRWGWALLLAGSFAIVWAVPLWAQTEPRAALAEPAFVPGVVLVGVRGEAVQAAGLDSVLGAVAPQAVAPLDLRGFDGEQGDGGVTGVQLTVMPGTEWAVIDQLRHDPAVAFAEPDWLAVIAQAEPEASVELPYEVTDDLYPDQWYLQRINLSRAWPTALDDAGQSLTTIRVAVIDTGVDLAHPDLAGHLLTGRNYLVAATAPDDDNGHGTHITGLIAGVLNNGGMAGVALQVKVDPLKALDAGGSGQVTIIAEAIRDAADSGARIINLSLQVTEDTEVLRSAVNYARSQDVLVVAAAGNCGVTLPCPLPVTYPAAYPGVVAVAATTYYDARAYYSAVGSQLDLAAPGGASGTSILSAWPSAEVLNCASGLRTIGDANYCPADGTSMAAGLVTGVAALVLSVRPDLTADELQDLLKETAAPISGSANEVGAGRIDAAQAVRRAITPHLVDLPGELVARVEPDDAPVRLTIPLENPAPEALTWSITRTSVISWFDIGGPITGVVSYGAPVTTQIVITPTELITRTTLGGLRLTTVAPDGGQTIYQIGVRAIASTFVHTRIPWISGGIAPYAWLEPDADGRVAYAMTDNGSIAVDLSFTFRVRGRSFTNARIYSDGLVTFPSTTVVSNLPNRCLTNAVSPGLAAYGWWADLNPSATGSRVSVFQPDDDRFVVEYQNVPSAAGVSPAYVVDFQIVLHRDGSIRYNYRTVPTDPPARVTIGVEAVDGRFVNQIVCRTDDLQLGVLPQRDQSLLIQPEDLY